MGGHSPPHQRQVHSQVRGHLFTIGRRDEQAAQERVVATAERASVWLADHPFKLVAASRASDPAPTIDAPPGDYRRRGLGLAEGAAQWTQPR